MVNGKIVVTRVTKNQFERIKINAQAKGFKTISEYLRSLALERDLIFDKKFEELYNKIINSTEQPKRNNSTNRFITDYFE